MFFKGMYIERRDQHTLTQGHCCISGQGGPTATVNFETYPMFVANRQHWKDAAVPGCDACWLPESQGHHSFRKGYVDWMMGQTSDPLQPELLKLDYNVGPLCNAKCVHCSANYSSVWAAEDAVHAQPNTVPVKFSHTARHNIIPQLRLDQLQTLYLNGGEPFLSTDLKDLLTEIDQRGDLGNLTFQSNTNGSVRPSDAVVDLWLRCKRVDIFVSIDAIEHQFEYIRYPLQWREVEDNIDFMCSLSPNIHVTFSFAMGVHNIDEMQRTWHWFDNNRQRRGQADTQFGIHRCFGSLDLVHSSQPLRQVWLDQLDPHGRWTPWTRTLITHGTDGDNHTWLQHLAMIDQRRQLDWASSLPDLHASWKKSLG